MSEANWYVVHTYSGYENKVKANIEKTIENRHLENEILEVRVPMQNVQETKNGVTKQTQKKLFPGYVLINMIMNDDTWYVVRNGIGSGKVESAPKQKYLVDFEKDDMVVVVAGAWKDTEGLVTDINAQRQTVTINVDLFGRETPVEISFADVKKK